MDNGTITAIATVAIALINTVGSVLMLWIRARYNYNDGVHKNGAPQQPVPRG